MERIERLARISAGSGPGVSRLPFTAAWEQANMLVGQWMEEAGMMVRRDEVGNLIGRYEGTLSGALVLMIGSHLDTAIEAGKYDGVLGVIGSVEVVQGLFESGIRLKHPIINR